MKKYLGIEFGSTRIKAVLIDDAANVLATGGFDWENHFEDGIWTYPLEEAIEGMQICYKNLVDNFGSPIKSLDGLGISGMMHGYLPFNKHGEQLSIFKTWRNNITKESAAKLTNLFKFNMPQRWSVTHLYKCILDKEPHVEKIDYLTTLAGYIHWRLSGKKVLGINDASGMFPIDINSRDYDKKKLALFDQLHNYEWNLKDVLPKVLVAGQNAGCLTPQGAKLLDPSGNLAQGVPMCPPEGDGGTGMVATNALSPRIGSVSAGTSAFAMLVLEKELKDVHTSLDMVTTPAGHLVAMAHSNNCSTEINEWVNIFYEFSKIIGSNIDKKDLYELLFNKSLEGDFDCGSLLPYCFHSGEHGLNLSNGVPMFIHDTNSKFNLANFIRSQIYTSFGAMKKGMDILIKDEGANVDKIFAQGGLFKTKFVAQKYLASAFECSVEVMDTASEGGAWGIAILALYLKSAKEKSLIDFCNKIFNRFKSFKAEPTKKEINGYADFFDYYLKFLPVETKATKIK